MQIALSVRHGSLSEATQERIRERIEKLPRYFERLTAIEVTVDLEHRDTPVVDVRMSAEHKHDFVAREQAEDLLAAVDAAVHKLEQQLRRYKEKVQDRHRGNGPREIETPRSQEEASL